MRLKKMIRTLTIVENQKEDGTVEYGANGSLPMDDAAKAMIIIAYQAIPPKKEEVSDSGQP
jgi:hypothetical protein